MVFSVMAREVWVPEVVLHESPLVPVTVHDAASCVVQCTCTVAFVCTMRRERDKEPDGVPLRHTDEPAEQKYGAVQSVSLVTTHSALVCVMVLPAQLQVGVQENSSSVPMPPAPVPVH